MAVKGVPRSSRGLAKVSIADINREVARRRKVASQLEAKRSKLLGRVAELEREIRGLGGNHNGRGFFPSPRAGRTQTLQEALASLLKGKTMSVTDMAEAVQKAGYQTNSPNFRTIVNAAVLKHTDLFQRVGRGQYTAK